MIYLNMFHTKGTNQGSKETLAQGGYPALVNSERRHVMPMKKPVRLLGMVFQIDK
jgi:hypothetical protein